jgi:hypothetical protein
MKRHGDDIMMTKRVFLRAAGAALASLALPAGAQYAQLLTVYKSPACGCCGDWVKHMKANGFAVDVRDLADVAPIRRKHGVPDRMASCHTALISGYVIEGHVPAADVKRLLRERPMAIGLAVPGMVVGSPGMEQGPPQPYATIAFDARSSRVYAQH